MKRQWNKRNKKTQPGLGFDISKEIESLKPGDYEIVTR
jgi:hypothetical protein